MRSSGSTARFNILIGIVLVLALVCTIRLFDLQIINGSDYQTQANRRMVRAYSIAAPRGEMLDCNDKPIVENRIGYSIQVQKIDLSNDEVNRILYNAAALAASYGAEIESTFPIVMDEKTENLKYDFTLEENGGTRKVEGVKLVKAVQEKLDEEKAKPDEGGEEKEKEKEEKPSEEEKAKAEEEEQTKLEEWKKKNKLKDYSSPEQILEHYRKKYEISSEFADEKLLTLVAIRYAMEKSGFGEKDPYILARDVDEIVLQQIKEQFMDYPGVDMVIEPVREYSNGKMAAHILGRTGKIYAEEYAELKDKGYGMNDIIGKDGLEKILEEYLKGQDGYKSVEMDRAGGVTQILESQPPKPGNFARLTLNRDIQKVAEEALAENVIKAVGKDGAGAVIAVDPRTCGVLAMASYPAYDITTFNEKYDEMLKSKSKPLINRVLNGTYSPGSTFKPLTSIAALESGVITPGTYITDKGKYTYYDSYQPTCLVYSSSGATHGTIEVSEAIGVSCNYFFYEVGRKMGIETIDEYATKFGLGQPTGIELPESTGILASPEYREKAGGVWYPGDVLQAAIGQSDNMFTPAQLASYVCTMLNKGKRYSLHVINEVVDYDTGEVVHKFEPEVLENTPISDSTLNAVKDGMRQVVSTGTASEAFRGTKYRAGGKTGTAEVPDGADNVLFVGFAPYDDPEIVIAVIIEHGASSSFAASVAREVFDAYMEIKDGTFEENRDEDESEEEEEKFKVPENINISDKKEEKKNKNEEAITPGAGEKDDENSSVGSGTL